MHYNYPTHLRPSFMAALLFVFLFSACQAKEGPELVAPGNNQTLVTNTPVLAWNPIDCDWQEVWINGIKMDSLGAEVNTYVPFALSFGENEWQIVAVKGAARIAGEPGSFIVNDRPLADLPEGSKLLREGWSVRSAAFAGNDGKELSSGNLSSEGWHNTSVPATAQSVLVRNGIYPNPYIGKNNMQIPDANDEFNSEHDLLKYSYIDGQNPWKKPYWYVKTFSVDGSGENEKVWLNFNEINYRAELWLNGELLADTSRMVGMERQFRFDVTNLVSRDGDNHLAVAVYPVDIPGGPGVPPVEPFGDPGVNMGDGMIGRNYTRWDAVGWDWQPAVRDRDMGITEDVFLSFTGDVELKDVYITSEPNLPEADYADMVISANLVNHSSIQKEGTLSGKIIFSSDTVSFDVPFSLSGSETKYLELDKEDLAQLRIQDPALWWPVGYGDPSLYEVKLTAETSDGDVSTVEENHGIRKIESRVEGSRIFTINGKDVFMKGGNWVIDMTLNWTASRYEEEILLSKNANLNILRVWGPTGVPPKAFYDAADKHGILLWQDFLNDYWGTFKNTPGYQPEKDLYKTISTHIVKRFRNHPSLIIWCGGNEGVNPREDLLVNTVLAENDNRSGRFYLKASDGNGLHGGGPYHSIRPEEFYSHPKLHGFSSEIGASGVPVIESIRRFIPGVGEDVDAGLFPVDGTWAYHDAANFPGEDSRKFTALDNIIRNDYGPPATTDQEGVEDYFAKAQFQNYNAYRAAGGSIARQMWDNSTGMLLWKANSSWPSMVWQLYDWYQQAHAGFYGVKKAFAPFHVQLNRDNRSISVVNSQYKLVSGVQVSSVLYDASSMEVLWKESQIMDVPENFVTDMEYTVPEKKGLVFLKLLVADRDGNILADNFYWLHPDNDFTGLGNIPSPELNVEMTEGEDENAWVVKLTNRGETPALLTRMKMVDRTTRHEILPALWSDNFVSMLPGETQKFVVTFPRGKYPGGVDVMVEPFN